MLDEIAPIDIKLYHDTLFIKAPKSFAFNNLLNEVPVLKNEKNESLQISSLSRKYWLDCLRALAMIIVVMAHSSSHLPHWDKFNVFLGPIMLPLFFAISGYLFHPCDGKQGVFYKKLFFKLVIPWIALSLIWIRALLIPIKGFSPYFTGHFYDFISGELLWFFSCCILAETIHFYIRKFIKSFYWICAASIAACSIGLLLAHYNIGDFFNINKAFIAQFYLLLGYIFRTKEDALSKLGYKVILPLLFSYLGMAILSIFLFPGQYIDVNRNMYPNIPLYFALITVGIFTSFLLAKKLDVKSKIFVFIGQNTLVIYSMHGYGFTVVRKLLSVIGIPEPNHWLFAIFLTATAVFLCGIGSVIVNRLFPEIVGKRRQVPLPRNGKGA